MGPLDWESCCCGVEEERPPKRSVDADVDDVGCWVDVCFEEVLGPSKRSIMELTFDFCGGGGDVVCGGEDIELPPPRISARRSALFWEPFRVVLRSAAGRSEPPIRSKSISCSVTLPGFLALF